MNFYREKPIIAITGSAGKTTVKNLVSCVLRERWVIFESNDYNNTTEKTKDHKEQINFIHRAAVLEYGMAYPGVITEHCDILQPNIGIITNIGLAHVGNFDGDINQLAAAKSELITGLNQSGILFVNGDDEYSKLLHTHLFKGDLYTVGIECDADYKASNVVYTNNGMSFDFHHDGEAHPFTIPNFGVHNVYNALFAIGVGIQLEFTIEELQNALEGARKPQHRLDVHRLKDDIIVIDDTVHANPPAMEKALDVLEAIGGKKLIVILGSMAELGDEIDYYHKKVGEYASTKPIDFIYTFGNISVNIGLGAIENGYPESQVEHKTPLYRRVMHRELLKMIEPGTTILVKGASRLNLYETVEYLCEHYKKD